MVKMLKHELKELYLFLRRNYNELVVMSSSTLFIVLAKYYPIGPEWVGSLVYYVALPVLVIVALLRRNPLDFGFRFGNCKIWLFHVAATVAVGLPILYFASRIPSLASYYTKEQFDLLKFSLETVANLFAWEFVFRGFLLFGLKGKFKEGSILIQMIPFALLHMGKPEIETISTIITGVYFGYVAYRGNSYWPALIIHLFVNISFLAAVNLL